MTAKRLLLLGLMAALFGVGYRLGSAEEGKFVSLAEASPASAVQQMQVFELRTYTAAEGKHDDLLARFRDHTLRIFEKHGMTNVGYCPVLSSGVPKVFATTELGSHAL